jgi:nucleoside-diphosphate-sugar epimerase
MASIRGILLAFTVFCITFFVVIIKLGRMDNECNLLYAANTSPRRRVGIVGAAGYIGSRLHARLREEGKWSVLAIDRQRPLLASFADVVELPAANLSDEELASLDTVVYLGGCSGRSPKYCRQEKAVYFRENVEDVERLARRMLPQQLLVFASTSGLAEGSGERLFSEDDPLATHLFDLHTESMMLRERVLRAYSEQHSTSAPQMIGLRIGSVMGVSPSQRLNGVHCAFVCSAFSQGVLHAQHSESHRAIISLSDLIRSLVAILSAPAISLSLRRFELFNLQSFNGSIASFANEVAFQTGALIDAQDLSPALDIAGFSVNSSRFSAAFNFSFSTSNFEVVRELVDHAPQVCVGRDLLFPASPRSEPCVVCGNSHMVTVLDLGEQPLANDFRSSETESRICPRFPLALVRCPICKHTQLSYFVDRAQLFSHYLYVSSTSRTMAEYFGWLAKRVLRDSGLPADQPGTVLELACNDGSQLDKFKSLGWRTFGIDPAANLAKLATAKGHAVHVGFWGVDHFPKNGVPYLTAEETTAIVAQNVFAHVLNPVEFLRACAAAMGLRTRLYIQTSQCRMLETGEFDTLYHEHVSFFTAHSFDFIARRVGLRVVEFEHTPVHGTSCLLTLVRDESSTPSSAALQIALAREVSLGLASDFSFVLYRAKAHNLRSWLNTQLSQLVSRGAAIVGFGAAAKGVVLIHFLRSESPAYEFEFVVDESPLKRGTFVPGTPVPVRNTDALLRVPRERLLVIVVLAWNFLDEIIDKISAAFAGQGQRRILGVVPFPSARIIDLSVSSNPAAAVLLQNPLRAQNELAILAPQRRPTLLVSHFFNEAMLLPHWIQHHAPMFDKVVLIDYDSTDASRDIIRREAPSSWRVMQSQNPLMNPAEQDSLVMSIESTFPGHWRIALTMTEFFVHPALREHLASLESSTSSVLRFRSFEMVGSDSQPLTRFASLVKQRSAYIVSPRQANERSYDGISMNSRFMHRLDAGLPYQAGRHSIDLPDSQWTWAERGFIAKYRWTPWPKEVNSSAVHDFSRPLGATDVELRASRDWFEVCRGDVRLDESK